MRPARRGWGEGTRYMQANRRDACDYLERANQFYDPYWLPICSIITWDIDWGACINNSTVWPHTVSARCCCLHLETHIPVCRVGELEICGDHVWEWTCHKKEHFKSQFMTGVSSRVSWKHEALFDKLWLFKKDLTKKMSYKYSDSLFVS